MTSPGDIAYANLAIFVRSLRREGFSVSSATTRQLATAGGLVGMHLVQDVREAFRAITVTRRSQVERFNELFDHFFTGEVLVSLEAVVDQLSERKPPRLVPKIGVASGDGAESDPETDEVYDIAGGSSIERLMDVDFADLSQEEAAALAALLASMIWTVSSFRSRRWQPSKRGNVPDLRRTLRMLTGPRGDLMPLAFSQRKPRQRPLIVLADISGSMERYSEMLLHFIHGAQSRFHRVESFVFATRLTRVTRHMKRRDPSVALAQIAQAVPDWSSGTRIGEAIGTFNRRWSRRVASGGPIVLIISDGWDTGEPTRLAHEMRHLRRSVNSIIWLNPLAGRAGFSPDARGMAAALPYVDNFVAGGTARNLTELVELLDQTDAARGMANAV